LAKSTNYEAPLRVIFPILSHHLSHVYIFILPLSSQTLPLLALFLDGRPSFKSIKKILVMYKGVTKSFRTGRLEQELQTVHLFVTRCSCIAILWVSLVSFTAITLCVDPQRAFVVAVVYFVIDSVRKLLDTPSYNVGIICYIMPWLTGMACIQTLC